jgi:hypothetical protein
MLKRVLKHDRELALGSSVGVVRALLEANELRRGHKPRAQPRRLSASGALAARSAWHSQPTDHPRWIIILAAATALDGARYARYTALGRPPRNGARVVVCGRIRLPVLAPRTGRATRSNGWSEEMVLTQRQWGREPLGAGEQLLVSSGDLSSRKCRSYRWVEWLYIGGSDLLYRAIPAI